MDLLKNGLTFEIVFLKSPIASIVCIILNVLQVAYAIGVAHPLSISIFHYGTSNRSERELLDIVKMNFDLRPGVIVRYGFL